MRPILKKVKKSQITLHDLKNKSILETLGKMLPSEYKKILKVKEVNTEALKLRDKDIINNGQYPKFWTNLKESEGKSKYDTRLKRFKILQVKYKVGNCKHSIVYQQIENVYHNLLNDIQMYPIRLSSISLKGLSNNAQSVKIDAKSLTLIIGKESIREKAKSTPYPNTV